MTVSPSGLTPVGTSDTTEALRVIFRVLPEFCDGGIKYDWFSLSSSSLCKGRNGGKSDPLVGGDPPAPAAAGAAGGITIRTLGNGGGGGWAAPVPNKLPANFLAGLKVLLGVVIAGFCPATDDISTRGEKKCFS